MHPQQIQVYIYIITLWLFNIAMGNGPFIDGLPIKNCDFPLYIYIYAVPPTQVP